MRKLFILPLALSTLMGAAAPLKVFILAGQSNMDGQAHVRTIDFLGETHPDLLKRIKPDGESFASRDDVWVAHRGVYGPLSVGYGGRRSDSQLGNKIGPEYAFGTFIGEALEEQVLLIKVAAGGTSIYENWRPPSAGPLEAKDPEKVGALYRGMVAYVKETLATLEERFPAYDEAEGYEVAGFVWFQGYNDMFNTVGRQQYGGNLVHMIKDLRAEFAAPEMRVVVGVMGVNGTKNETNPKQRDVRNGQRSVNEVPDFKGNVRAIETAPFLHEPICVIRCAGWLYPERNLKTQPITEAEQAMLNRATSDKGYHYFGSGRFFVLMGKAMAETMLDLLPK